jgi:predicted RND superfamily exporter protein
MNSFARWLVHHPLVVIGANLLVTVILGYYALHIRVERSLASVLPAGDPQVEYYARIREIFGSDDVAIVGVCHAGFPNRRGARPYEIDRLA